MQTFEQWFDSQRDAVWGVVGVDLPEDKALRFARRVWDAAVERCAAICEDAGRDLAEPAICGACADRIRGA